MGGEEQYITLSSPNRGPSWTMVGLFALLVFGTILAIALAGYLYINDVEEEQAEQIQRNSELITEIRREQAETVVLSSRAQRLDLEGDQQQLRLLLCTLRPNRERCGGVVRQSKRLNRAIADLERDIKRHIRVVRRVVEGNSTSSPEPNPDPPPPNPPPSDNGVPPGPPPPPSTVGNSDQCPPRNPHC